MTIPCEAVIKSLIGMNAKVSNGVENHNEVVKAPSKKCRKQAEWRIVRFEQGYVKDKTTFLR